MSFACRFVIKARGSLRNLRKHWLPQQAIEKPFPLWVSKSVAANVLIQIALISIFCGRIFCRQSIPQQRY